LCFQNGNIFTKVVNTRLSLLEVHVSHSVEVNKYHTNYRLNFESYCRFRVDEGLYLATFRKSNLEEANFKWTFHEDSIGLVAKQY